MAGILPVRNLCAESKFLHWNGILDAFSPSPKHGKMVGRAVRKTILELVYDHTCNAGSRATALRTALTGPFNRGAVAMDNAFLVRGFSVLFLSLSGIV